MKSEITEISYSTALTYELVTQYGFLTLAAPTLPSLRKEVIYQPGKKIKAEVLFIQYKLGDYIIGTGSSLKAYWGIPYYRFSIHPRNKYKRHDLLRHLEGLTHLVYYVAPEFHTMNELYDSLMSRKVIANSRFWAPEGIEQFTKAGRYTISYKRGVNQSILEPGNQPIESALKGKALFDRVRQSTQASIYDDEKIYELGDVLLDNYLEVFRSAKERRLIGDIRSSRERIDSRDYLSMISILLYDCYVYIVPAGKQEQRPVG